MLELIQEGLLRVGVTTSLAGFLARCVTLVFSILGSLIAYVVLKRVIKHTLTTIINHTGNTWDDVFLHRRVFHRLAYLVPMLLMYRLTPLALEGHEPLIAFATGGFQIGLIFVALLVADSLLNATVDIYATFPVSREIPIIGFVQTIKIVLSCIGGIFFISILLNQTPVYLLSGLGALTAVLLLIFKDPILGFVAGIQLAANKMLAQGDWIDMPKHGADGEVLEVNLTTVKVQNWDRTITTIPTYALISDSFKNWRGMKESGGRRIKRSIFIDINTIKFCTEEMLTRFSQIQYISAYIASKKVELAEYNIARQFNGGSLVNGRRMTNIGTFRAYVTAYLKNHPMINPEMTFLVRQLTPSEYGLPIELYVFCRDIVWANYEAIQADIFDHILAVVPEFDLRVFQIPTGRDFSGFTQNRIVGDAPMLGRDRATEKNARTDGY